ncbi:PDR/VanB family oxidoreductase [Halioxenophilus aromaticivorans]|uniref:PDR/VanB family oxidoreductase n=1 Tax=Halioxenophilus aromaticivorans TaxID=1306992 RepID=A0AAV3U648_9ALTE
MTNPDLLEKSLQVTIDHRQDIDGRIAILDLMPTADDSLPAFSAGAHIDVHINDNLIRQYSLCTTPEQFAGYRLAVMEEPSSRGGSRTIFQQFAVGQTITISPPRNHFELQLPAQKVLLLAAGIGITPLYAMAQTLKAQGQDFELHYCLKEPGTGAFEDEIKSQFSEQSHFHYSRVAESGRLDLPDLLKSQSLQTHIYLCGPAGFLDWACDCAKAAGLPADQVHFEYFNAEVELTGNAFEIYCSESDVSVQVGPTDTIAQALKAAGVKVDVSCEEGVCGTCIMDVLEGEPEHRDHFLSDEEKADNDQIAVCCSRAKSAKLILDC